MSSYGTPVQSRSRLVVRTGRLHSLQLVEAMASNTQTLDRMAELLSQAASQLKQVGHQEGRQEVEQRELAQKVGKMERINQDPRSRLVSDSEKTGCGWQWRPSVARRIAVLSSP